MRVALSIFTVSIAFLVAVACGSDDQSRALASAGTAGKDEAGGASPHSGGSLNLAGDDGLSGSTAMLGGAAGSMTAPGGTESGGAENGGAENGGAGNGGAANGGAGGDPEVPPTVVA